MSTEKNIIDWFSLPSNNFERAVTFYETILGIEMPRQVVSNGTKMALF
jgi:predicted enzyme related to lactoylglutathione lyase